MEGKGGEGYLEGGKRGVLRVREWMDQVLRTLVEAAAAAAAWRRGRRRGRRRRVGLAMLLVVGVVG